MILLVILLTAILTSALAFSSVRPGLARWVALSGSLAVFALSVIAVAFNSAQQTAINLPMAGNIGTSFSLQMDGLSALLVLLTTFLTPLIILSAFERTYRRPNAFFGLIMLMEMALIGVFTAHDGLLFYIFWELALVPIYFIAGLWGSTDKIRITFKFFVYTLFGSLFMLVALIVLYQSTPAPHSFSFEALYAAKLSLKAETWIFAAFFLAFAIKIPIFPFHTWQPDTYNTAPYQGSMLLAGIMLKMGIYGIIRLMIPLCRSALTEWGWLAIGLSVTGIVYASVIAIRQDNLKRMIAYASIAHVGLIAAGAMVMNPEGLRGAAVQMLSHGINIVAMFAMIEMIQVRAKTRKISELGGIATQAPVMAAFFMIVVLATVALPLTNGFVGEFLLLLGVFKYHPIVAAVSGLTIIFTAVYLLWMNQRVMFGKTKAATAAIADLNTREVILLTPLVIMIFWIGVYPATFIKMAEPALSAILGK